MSVYRGSYKDRAGKSCRTNVHYVEVRGHDGRRHVIKGFHDRAASNELQRKLLKLAALRASDATPDEPTRRWIEGLAPALRDRLAEIGLLSSKIVAGLRPLGDLIDAWTEHLRASGNGEHHVTSSAQYARRVFDGIGANFWSDIDASRVEAFLRAEREKKERPIGARSSNGLLASARQFCRWCVRTGRAVEDPLRSIVTLNVAQDRRYERRALTPNELRALLAATAAGPTRNGMSGPERALLYRVAVETGLRCGEITALVVGDLDVVDEETASVRVSAATAKNGREARLPLRPATARALADLVACRTPLARVFAAPKSWEAAKTLRADLAEANIVAKDDAGRVVDFHALRTTFGTNLARGGVSLQLAQRLMRHSTPTLTANVYTVLTREDERAALKSLPDLSGPAIQAQRATGTAGAVSRDSVLRASLREEAGKRGKTRDRAGILGLVEGAPVMAAEPAETLASEAADGGEFAPVAPRAVVGRAGFGPATSTL